MLSRFKRVESLFTAGGRPWAGFLLAFAAGAALLATGIRPGQVLTRASYNWSFDLGYYSRPDLSDCGVVIVYMDRQSHMDLGQSTSDRWDRKLHARLLRRIAAEKPRAIMMDILFLDESDDESDREFEEAIAHAGNVILGANYFETIVPDGGREFVSETIEEPLDRFAAAAAGVGSVNLKSSADFIIREHLHRFGTERFPSLTWVTAETAGVPVASREDPAIARWVYYYGPAFTIPSVSYSRALAEDGLPPGTFRDKIVIVGARPDFGYWDERRDEFRNPYESWRLERFAFMPMAEVHATILLNLLQGDWLTRLAPVWEWAILLAAAVVFGAGLSAFRPLAATGLAVAGAGCAIGLAGVAFVGARVWFPWMIVVFGQLPLALVWAISSRSVEWYLVRRRLELERRKAELQIREQAALLDKAQDAILVHDLDWLVHYWNNGAERMFGLSAAAVLNHSIIDLLFNSRSAAVAEARQKVLDSGEWTGELRCTSSNGAELVLESRWTLIRDDAGAPTSILQINTDVTEKRRLETQFLRAQRMESIGTLAGGIAHDLNNVLTPIGMAVELLTPRVLDAGGQKVLRTVDSSVRRASDLVKQVLTFARGHEGEKVTLQITPLIKELEKILRETFPRSINITVYVAPNLDPMLGDATRLHQILLNLCVNARDAMPNGGDLVLEVENCELSESDCAGHPGTQPGRHVMIQVSDTGTGIPHEIADRIFEPFFTTKEVGKGTGLGLSTVASIVKSFGGIIELQSEPGRGTTFTLYFPVAELSLIPVSGDAAEPLPRGRGELVLVVDDEEAIRDTVRSTLITYGYRVETAIHGSEAVSVCTHLKDQLDVVLVDMMMPVMDGPSTVRALKRLKPSLRFVVTSGVVQPQGLPGYGGVPEGTLFIAKPFTTERLLRAVHRALNESPPSQPPQTPGPSGSLAAAEQERAEPELAEKR